ncbi:phage tail assembly protein [Paenibacillus daejeonensis]|uniref:phage tail assembly protein n=1 Tax=Paenibacillus daejeonensis TaxID=135193 RepID=UPI00037A5BD5|nr:phage tail assembly protein [Paenibacillus daejeonensis]
MTDQVKTEEDVTTETPATSIYTLRRAWSFEGGEVKDLNLDFDRLTGEDIISCERQYMQLEGASMLFKDANKEYQAYVAARAAKVPVELIRALPAKDFSMVTLRAQRFLLG